MLAINDVNDVFCDALVCDEGYLVFASFWGRDTAIQELLARLTLSPSEGGLSQLSFNGYLESQVVKVENHPVKIGNPDRLDKMTGRMPKSNLFGDLVHLWLFDKKARTPDYVNRQVYLLLQPGQDDQPDQAWRLIKQVCHLPLLDNWQDAVLNIMRDHRWLKKLDGYQMNLLCITIPENEFDQEMSQMIQQGQLTVINEVV